MALITPFKKPLEKTGALKSKISNVPIATALFSSAGTAFSASYLKLHSSSALNHVRPSPSPPSTALRYGSSAPYGISIPSPISLHSTPSAHISTSDNSLQFILGTQREGSSAKRLSV